MNAKIDRMDVVRAQYVVCKSGDEWFEEYDSVYYAMEENREFAGKFIGLILWDVLNTRFEDWMFHKIDKIIVDEHNWWKISGDGVFRAGNFRSLAVGGRVALEASGRGCGARGGDGIVRSGEPARGAALRSTHRTAAIGCQLSEQLSGANTHHPIFAILIAGFGVSEHVKGQPDPD